MFRTLLLLLALPLCALAQDSVLMASNPLPPGNPDFTIHRSVDEVHVQFRVTDKRHLPVTDLRREQVSVLDMRRPVEPLVDFRSERNLPLHIALLLDVSDSVEKQFPAEQQLAITLMREMLHQPDDRGLVIAFGTSVRQLDTSTADPAALEQAIRSAAQGGQTALYTAVVRACEALRQLPAPDGARRVMVVISDGEDTYSFHTLAEAIQATLNSDVVLYSISARHASYNGYEALKELAENTGGRLFKGPDAQKLAPVFATIEQELRSQYMVAFRPPERDGRFHRLEVRVDTGQPVTVQARSGYWAPKR